MKIEELNEIITAKMNELQQFQQDQLPDIIGTEAVNHYKDGFAQEGFINRGVIKWEQVKRRMPESGWYGKGVRATDKILTGNSGELKNSIHYVKTENKVTVRSDKPYSAVHQFGLSAKIYGKKEFTMKARPFIGFSDVLISNIYKKIESEIKKILNI